MDDGYEKCAYCKWVGKLRKDGTIRKHRVSVDMGHFTMSGGLKQETNGPICEGSGKEPWDWTPPEGGYVISSRPTEVRGTEPTLEEYAQASRFIQSHMPGVRR